MVRWWKCGDERGRVFYVRAQSAADAKTILGVEGYTLNRRYPSGRTSIHCDKVKLPSVIPAYYNYCYVFNRTMICEDDKTGFSISIPLEEVEKALEGVGYGVE